MHPRRLALLALLLALVALVGSRTAAAAVTTTLTGTLRSGATYLIDVPPNWNGTLVLYSHGYVIPGSPNPARDVGDPVTRAWLLDHGYALAGSSYSRTGWALEQAFQDQPAVLDVFAQQVGRPHRTIAWGHSLGGIITAGLIQKFPDRFAAALPMCGVLAGGVGVWNEALDAAFVFKLLLAPASPLQLVHITNPSANFALAQQILAAAQATPQGRARLALAAAIGDLPGWFDPFSPEPARTDVAARERNQFLWNQNVDFLFAFALRAELEARADGNPSWNTGVNYRTQLAHSINADEVQALYKQAGLDLEDDLATLAHTARIAADPGAVNYLVENIVFNGDLRVPVLTLHTTGDGLVLVQDEQAYASVVRAAGDARRLRQAFVHRAGHCTFTPAETIAAFQALVGRMDTGRWADTTQPAALNAAAAALGSARNVLGPVPTAPAFIQFEPSRFLRPFDRTGEDEHHDDDMTGIGVLGE
jgi:dienelactone hydrolase